MACTDRRAQSGFTIIEALVSTALFAIAFLAVLMTYSQNRRIYADSTRRIDLQQNARLAVAEITRQLRMAGYFPENVADPPASPLLADPIRVATESALAVYGDIDGSGASGVVLYCLDGAVLRRGLAPPDDADAYTCSAGDVLAENVAGLTFAYFDADANPVPDPAGGTYELDGEDLGAIPDLSDTTERGSVRRVVVTLTMRQERLHLAPVIYSLTSDVVLRNLS